MTIQQALSARWRARLIAALSAVGLHALSCGVTVAQTPTAASASLETANAVLFGKSSALTYAQAVEVVQRRAEQSNLVALRMNVAMWRTPLPHPEHRTSHVATYLGARRLLAVAPGEGVRDLLTDPAEFAALGDELGDLVYEERVDVMSDERACSLMAQPIEGVVFGLNNRGAFVRGSPTVALEEYARFALRVDANAAHAGTKPDAVEEYEKLRESLPALAARGTISMAEFERYAAAAKAKLRAAATVYIAEVNTAEFERLLRELSVGDSVRARVILPDGRERVVSWSLLTTERGDPRAVNYLDLLAYRYVNCVFGPLR
jgi:hypothetical protein